jgi:hypothetical protein
MTEVLSVKAISTAIASAWARGSLLLWALAAASGALGAVLHLCVYLQIDKASTFWADYGLPLILLTVVFVILATFKTIGEREKSNLSLIANERESFWHQAAQSDGRVITQLSLRFQATNVGDSTIQLSGINLNRPWVRHSKIMDKMLHTRHPTQNTYGSKFPIKPHSLTEASAHIIVKGAVGGAGRRRPMRVSISVQDHMGRWHKLVFPRLKDPSRA